MSNAAILSGIINRNALHAQKFGDRKAYISSVFAELPNAYQAKGIESFKADLLELNRAGLVELIRADLVKEMDAKLLRESEIVERAAWGNSEFHFIKVAA